MLTAGRGLKNFGPMSSRVASEAAVVRGEAVTYFRCIALSCCALRVISLAIQWYGVVRLPSDVWTIRWTLHRLGKY